MFERWFVKRAEETKKMEDKGYTNKVLYRKVNSEELRQRKSAEIYGTLVRYGTTEELIILDKILKRFENNEKIVR